MALTAGDDPVASDAEEYLVAAMLMFPEAVLHLGRLQPDEFYNPRHRVAFESLQALYDRNEPVDLMTFEAEVNRRGMLEAVGGVAALARYMLLVPTGDNAGYYASIIRERSFGRRLRVAAAGATTRLEAGADWRGELVGLRTALEDLEDQAHTDPPTLRAAVEGELASIRRGDASTVGLPTGVGIERACPAGVPLGYVTTLFGESGSFKSTIVNNVAWSIAAAGHGVLHVSWEDSTQLTAQRFIAQQTGIGYGRLAARVLEDHERGLTVGETAQETAGRIIMAGSTDANMDSVIRAARLYKRLKGISVVVVDYLQIMDYENRGNRHEAISDAVKTAQRAAAKDGLAYILVSQVKTDIGERDDPRPKMEDCFGSGAIKQFTKLGISVFRPWRYCRVPAAKGAYSEYHRLAKAWPEGADTFLRTVYPRILELGLDKNVMGEAPVLVHVLVDPPTGRIEPFDPKAYIDGNL